MGLIRILLDLRERLDGGPVREYSNREGVQRVAEIMLCTLYIINFLR